MASDWYYRQDDQELGPHTFRDLVEMVREEQISPETLVRPHYLDEWQRADSVVGLFYMARRDPATLPPIQTADTEADSEFADVDELDQFLTDSEATEQEANARLAEQDAKKPGWLRRLLSLRDSKIPPVPVNPQHAVNVNLNEVNLNEPVADDSAAAAESLSNSALEEIPGGNLPVSETTDDADEEVSTGAYSDETWASTVNAAVERVDARAPKQEELPPPRQIVPAVSLSFLESPLFRKLMFTVALLACASAGIYAFQHWMGQGKLFFPLVGETSPLLFLVYSACTFLVTIILGMLITYIASPYLRHGFKLGSAVVTASITVFYLLNWSRQQNLIFPSRKLTESKLYFPIMGECTQFAYWMYFVDVVIVVAVLTYFAAWWLEAHADDV